MTGVSSLTDASGRFFRQALIARCASGKVRKADIRRGFRFRWTSFAAHGLTLAHIDSHQHCHMMPVIFLPFLADQPHWRALRLAFTNAPLSLLWRRPVRFSKQAVADLHDHAVQDFAGCQPMMRWCRSTIWTSTESELADTPAWWLRSGARRVELFVHPYQLGRILHQL